MVLNNTKLPWMRDDRVILSLPIGAHSGDDIIEAWTHQAWARKHAKKCRIIHKTPEQKFSDSKFDLFMGFENTYNLKVRAAPNYVPMSEYNKKWVVLPDLELNDLIAKSKHDYPEGSIPDSLHKIHAVDKNAFNIQRSKNLLRQMLDLVGFSCFRYRYNYTSKKITESMELAQYVDTTIIGSDENPHNLRLNHRFFIIDAVSVQTHLEDMRARIAGKALITAIMKYMAGVSRNSEIEIFIFVGRGTKVWLFRIVFEPEYLGDISRGLEPAKAAVMWEDPDGELELLRKEDRSQICTKLDHIRRCMHVRI